MKDFLIIILLVSGACQSPKHEGKEISMPKNEDTLPTETIKTEESTDIIEKLAGDFNGDGQLEEAQIVQTRKQQGNPVEVGTPAEYTIQFTNQTLPALLIHCCAARLLKEGDLNGDGLEELSIFQAPENGNTYRLITYSFQQNQWQELITPLIIPVIDQELTLRDLQGRVYREADKVFIQEMDINDANFRLIKKEAKLKQSLQ